MPLFKVYCSYTTYGEAEVEAATSEEACEMVELGDAEMMESHLGGIEATDVEEIEVEEVDG